MIGTLAERWAEVSRRIEAARARGAAAAPAVEVVAVTKTHPAEVVREALRAGLTHLGESKVQEARAKVPEVGAGVWHFIGHLQSNKAKLAAHLFDWVDSVDSAEIGEELNRRAEEAGKRLRVLVQVNVAGESQKFGLPPDRLPSVLMALNALPRLEVRGLMTIAPAVRDPEEARPVFRQLRQLRDGIQEQLGLDLPELSMGMTADFEVAVEEGATQVRLGSVLFGKRSYPARKGEL